MKVMLPVGLLPPDNVAESFSTAVPTVPPGDGVVAILGEETKVLVKVAVAFVAGVPVVTVQVAVLPLNVHPVPLPDVKMYPAGPVSVMV